MPICHQIDKTISVPYSLQELQFRSDYMGDYIKVELHRLVLDIGDRAKTSALFQRTLTFKQPKNKSLPPPPENLTIFFSQHGVARVEISSRAPAPSKLARTYKCLPKWMRTIAVQSNFNGSNIFGTMEICSRYG